MFRLVCVLLSVLGAALPAPASAGPTPAPARADRLPPESEPAPLLIPGRPNPVDTTAVDPAQEARRQFEFALGLEQAFPAAAIVTYRKALRLDPSLPEAEYRMGLLFNRRGEWAEAVKCFTLEVERNPNHEDAARELGVALSRTGRHTRAVEQLETLSRKHPKDGRVWHALGFAYSRAGRPAEAEKAIRKAIQLPPPDVEEHRDLGALLASLGRDSEAREEYRRALALAPRDPATSLNLGNLERKAGHRDSALACYQRAVQSDSAFSLAYQGQVQLLREMNRLADVSDVYRRWLAHVPDEHGARLEAVQLLFATGRPDEALSLAHDGMVASPASGSARFIYGIALAGRGRLREALPHLRAAQRLYGRDAREVARVEMMITGLRATAPDSLRALFRADSVAHRSAPAGPRRTDAPGDTSAPGGRARP